MGGEFVVTKEKSWFLGKNAEAHHREVDGDNWAALESSHPVIWLVLIKSCSMDLPVRVGTRGYKKHVDSSASKCHHSCDD